MFMFFLLLSVCGVPLEALSSLEADTTSSARSSFNTLDSKSTSESTFCNDPDGNDSESLPGDDIGLHRMVLIQTHVRLMPSSTLGAVEEANQDEMLLPSAPQGPEPTRMLREESSALYHVAHGMERSGEPVQPLPSPEARAPETPVQAERVPAVWGSSGFEEERALLARETASLGDMLEKGRLRRENEDLSAEAEALRREAAERQLESAQLRRQLQLQLQLQNRTGPSATYAASSLLPSRHGPGGGNRSSEPGARQKRSHGLFHGKHLLVVEAILAVLFLASCLCLYGDCALLHHTAERAEPDEAALLHFAGERDQSLLCHSSVLCFLWLVLLSAAFIVLALWRSGELQRILTEMSVQAYCSVVLAAFYSLLFGLLCELVRRLVRYIVKEFKKMKDLNPLRRARMSAMG